MPAYEFALAREATESARVLVFAASIEEAQELALNDPHNFLITAFETDDGYGPVYLPDPNDYEVTKEGEIIT